MLPPHRFLFEWLLLDLREFRPYQLDLAVHLLDAFKP